MKWIHDVQVELGAEIEDLEEAFDLYNDGASIDDCVEYYKETH
jgi:hypothetical protein